MQSILIEKLRAYILINNPDLVVQLQADYAVTQYLQDKILGVMPMVEKMLAEDKPSYIIEELCLNQMTTELRPSKFNYIQSVIEEEFKEEYQKLLETGVLTYETINLVESCKDIFESFEFSATNEDNRFMRYAVIAEIHSYFN